jgi:hypothetical protein
MVRMNDQASEGSRSIVDELLSSGADDWVQLHDVVWLSTEGDRSDEAKQRTVGVLRQLFANDLMVPGELGETGFEDWPGSPDDWERRAISDLERLDWNPMGDGPWLRLAGD